jgi:hypothetical protein
LAATLAPAPSEGEDLSELAVHRVGGEKSELRLVSLKADLGVDVEHTVLSAWRPDGGSRVDCVGEGVVRRVWALEVGLGAGLVGVTGEVVGGLLGSGLALGELGVAAVGGLEDAVLPATWVSEVDVQLAVLAVFDDANAWAHGSDVFVKDQCESGTIRRDLLGDGASRAASSTSGNGLNPDGAWIWAITSKDWVGRSSGNNGEEGSSDSGGGELHLECKTEDIRQIFDEILGKLGIDDPIEDSIT